MSWVKVPAGRAIKRSQRAQGWYHAHQRKASENPCLFLLFREKTKRIKRSERKTLTEGTEWATLVRRSGKRYKLN